MKPKHYFQLIGYLLILFGIGGALGVIVSLIAKANQP
jgi:hypothetical protein